MRGSAERRTGSTSQTVPTGSFADELARSMGMPLAKRGLAWDLHGRRPSGPNRLQRGPDAGNISTVDGRIRSERWMHAHNAVFDGAQVEG
jgi:hypothetical protein